MIIIIDNNDSFTYILFQYLLVYNKDVIVRNKSDIDINGVNALNPKALVFSPGPGSPSDANLCKKLLSYYTGRIPILGVCLGMQIIVEFFKGEVIKNYRLMHGKLSLIQHSRTGIFKGIKSPIRCMRYHSLITNPEKVPADLNIIAWTDEREIMGISHKNFPIYGVQFHPESIGTEYGHSIIRNFIKNIATN